MSELEIDDAKILLRVLRALHDWSQADLAERSGVAEASIRRYESGEAAPPPEVVERLADAARIPSYFLHGSLLSALRFARMLAFPEPNDPTDYPGLEESVEAYAQESAELARGHYRRSWIEAVLREEAERAERDANAWRPTEAHREEAALLWERLEPCTREERSFLLDHAASFRSWAVVERIAEQTPPTSESNPDQALEWAELAVEIALRVDGQEGWPDRVRGYAYAALAFAQRAAGKPESAAGSADLAARHWQLGAAFPGLLEEARCLELLGSGRPESRKIDS